MLTRYLGDKPFWKKMWKVALPIVLQCFLNNSFSIVDSIMVSTMGDRTLSAAGIASQWTMVSNAFLNGLAAGLAVFCAQYFGIGDRKGIRRSFGIALSLGILFLSPFVLLARLIPGSIVRIYNKDAQVIELSAAYLRIVCWSFPATMLANQMSAVLRSTEKVKLCTAASVISMALNVLGNYSLIYGKFGLPEMGVRGAALSTVISSWSGPAIMLLGSLIKPNILIGPVRELFSFTLHDVISFLKKAMPVAVNYLTYLLAATTLYGIRSNMGYEYAAATSILNNVVNLFNALFSALQSATHILVGKQVGAGKIEEAKRDSARFLTLISLNAVLVGVTVMLTRGPMVSLFNLGGNMSELTVQTARTLCIFYGSTMLLRYVPIELIDGISRAGGDTRISVIADGIAAWGIAVPVSFLLADVLHTSFLTLYMISMTAENAARAVIAVPHYLSGRWLKPVTKEGREGLEAYLAAHPKKKRGIAVP